MSQEPNPGNSPDQGQAPGQDNPGGNSPAAGGSQPDGGKGTKIELDADEVQRLRRDAGRWSAHQENERKNRRQQRQSRPSDQNIDGASPEVLEALRLRDEKLDDLSVENRELKVKNQVRDLLDGEDYQKIPNSLKRAIIRNPLGFVNRNSETIEDAIADIQDYLDDELDNPGSSAAPKGNEAEPKAEKERQTPPASGSAPASPNEAQEVDVAGKTGPARSTAILSNLLKKRGN